MAITTDERAQNSADDSSDEEVKYLGFQCVDISKSEYRAQQLEAQGIVYTGHNNTKIVPERKVTPPEKTGLPNSIEPAKKSTDSSTTADKLASSNNEQRRDVGMAANGKSGPNPRAPHPVLRTPAMFNANQRRFFNSQVSRNPIYPKRLTPANATSNQPSNRPKPSAPSAQAANPHKRPRELQSSPPSRTREYIVISDSDDEPPPKDNKKSNLWTKSSLASRSATTGPSTSDREELQGSEHHIVTADHDCASESEFESAHAGLDILDDGIWRTPENWTYHASRQLLALAEDDEPELVEKLETLMVSSAAVERDIARQKGRARIQPRSAVPDSLPRENEPTGYRGEREIWTELQAFLAHIRLYDEPSRTRNPRALDRNLRPAWRVCRAPGAINMIAQCNGVVVMASAVDAGTEDPISAGDEMNMSPYNREGTLTVWHESICNTGHTLRAHERLLNAETGVKHYTVEDVQFNPTNPDVFVSCGTDRKVSVWSCKEVESGGLPKLVHEMYYECTMGSLLFKPRDPLLAMGGRDGQIYLQTHSRGPITRSRIRVAPTDSSQEISDMLWGTGGTVHMLFASTGEREPDVFSGVHKALDVPTRKAVCVFDISEDGEKIAIDNYGANLVLATRSTDVAHSLRLYDARRLRPRATSKIDLEPFPGDVNALQFSPDGIYLAVARSDNTVHIFDSRKLTRGTLHVFSHEFGDADEKHCFGVVNALWVDGTAQGLSLVTGGADGCIRSWDVRRASNDPSNGVVLARHDRDIGYFALGDPYKNEKPLLVGENSGIVTIYEGSLHSSPF